MEMKLYSNLSYDTIAVSSQHATESKNTCCIKCLVAGWIINFVLIVAVVGVLGFFLTRTALKPEEDAQIQDIIQSTENQSGQICPPGPPGPSGPPGIAGPAGAKGEKGATGATGSQASVVCGVSYIRWGKSVCRSNVTRVYSGRTGVSYAYDRGGASNYICMPNDPQYTLAFRPGVQGDSFVYGTEYERLPPGHSVHQHNAVCAVCYVADKHTTIMIPAHTSCPSGSTKEYYGYLISEHKTHHRTMYQCVDIQMEYVPGSQTDVRGGHFYFVEAHCNGCACPPYDSQKELGCVVCSK